MCHESYRTRRTVSVRNPTLMSGNLGYGNALRVDRDRVEARLEARNVRDGDVSGRIVL